MLYTNNNQNKTYEKWSTNNAYVETERERESARIGIEVKMKPSLFSIIRVIKNHRFIVLSAVFIHTVYRLCNTNKYVCTIDERFLAWLRVLHTPQREKSYILAMTVTMKRGMLMTTCFFFVFSCKFMSTWQKAYASDKKIALIFHVCLIYVDLFHSNDSFYSSLSCACSCVRWIFIGIFFIMNVFFMFCSYFN